MRRNAGSSELRNWAENQRCHPVERHAPRSVAEVSELVARAAHEGRRIKVVGAGHSFSGVAMTDGVLLTLDRLNAVESVSHRERRVTVQAGIRLHELNDALDRFGLAMPNLGDIAYQSIAGAIATATHGTGLRLGNLATAVVGMEVVTGDGEVRWLAEDDELLRVARVGIGALGVVTRVRLQCVPSFNLHVRESVEPIDDVVDHFEEEITSNDHFELFWIPGQTRCLVKRNNRTSMAARPRSRLSHFVDKVLAENVGFGAACRLGRRFPKAVPALGGLVSAAMSEHEGVDRSDRVFASPRMVRFYESEYAVGVESFREAFERVRHLTERLAQPPLMPLECRVSAADDIPLSTAYRRDTAWIACHVYEGRSYDDYFPAFERIMDRFDGRPHWGKLHFQDHQTLRARYPEWEAFTAARRTLDPRGVFRNEYLDRVLGAPSP